MTTRPGCVLLLALAAGLAARDARAGAALVQRIETWSESGLRVENPSGIAFLPGAGSFLLVDKTSEGSRSPRSGRAWEVALDGKPVARGFDLASLGHEPSDVCYHAGRGTLFVTDDDALRLHELDLEGKLLATIDLAALGSQDPEGIACAPEADRLFVADGHGERILELTSAGKLVGSFSIAELDFGKVEGIAWDAGADRLLLVSDDAPLLFELARDGRLIRAQSLVELGAVRPRGLVLAPSSDPRDPADTQSLYVADEMTKREPDGRILELARVERPRGARTLVDWVGDPDGFGFQGDEPGFATGDLDHDGLLEPGERLPAAPGRPSPDNRTPEDSAATDVLVVVGETAPLRFRHSLDLAGGLPSWARLTLAVGDARALPGARSLVRADGRLVGEIVGTRGERLHAGTIDLTVLELPPQTLRDLADGSLQVEIARAPGSGGDDVMLDYSRLEVAVPR